MQTQASRPSAEPDKWEVCQQWVFNKLCLFNYKHWIVLYTLCLSIFQSVSKRPPYIGITWRAYYKRRFWEPTAEPLNWNKLLKPTSGKESELLICLEDSSFSSILAFPAEVFAQLSLFRRTFLIVYPPHCRLWIRSPLVCTLLVPRSSSL